MNRRSIHPVIMMVIAIAAFGFFYQLFVSPGALVKTFMMIAVGAAVFFLLYKLFFQQRMGGKESSAYRRAVKQSKKRVKSKESSLTSIKSASKAKKRRSLRPVSTSPRKKDHLTVIEGRKGKKKNRALF